MENYVTLFDSFFLPQGLALYLSMRRELKSFTLWVICVDSQVFSVLDGMALPHVKLISLASVETAELLGVKPGRSVGEYCWTLTPFAPKFVFDADDNVSRVTYLDADLWFRQDPSGAFDEFERSGKTVLITDHLYAPQHDHSETNGKFCVQFMTFSRGTSEPVRKWWEEKCIEWCYARFEAGRFGDQKYLDDWPVRFNASVHVLSEALPVLAPWNATRFPYNQAFAVHFHGVRLLDRGRVLIADNYEIPEVTFKQVYSKYFRDIAESIALLGAAGFEVKPQAKRLGLWSRMINRLRRVYWIFRVIQRTELIRLPVVR